MNLPSHLLEQAVDEFAKLPGVGKANCIALCIIPAKAG